MPFPHPQTGQDNDWQENKPDGIHARFRRNLAVNGPQNGNAQNKVGPSQYFSFR